MKKFVSQGLCALAVCVAVLAMSKQQPAQAAESGADDAWRYGLTLYLWGTNIGGETSSGSGGIDADFNTILDNLDMAFLGTFTVGRGDWTFLGDVVYLNVSGDESGSIPVSIGPGPGFEIATKADLDLKSLVLNLLGAYTLSRTEQASFSVLGGARYLDVDADFKLRLESPAGQPREGALSLGDRVWDAVLGVRGEVNFNRQWYLPYYLDVGTGESDLTWQAWAGLGYRFDWGQVLFGYRHLEWDLGSDRAVQSLKVSGPALGVRFDF